VPFVRSPALADLHAFPTRRSSDLAAAVQSIIENRADGPYTSLFDLAERIDLRVAGRRVLEALILSGACDQLAPPGEPHPHRAQMMEGLDLIVREAQLRQEEKSSGQAS